MADQWLVCTHASAFKNNTTTMLDWVSTVPLRSPQWRYLPESRLRVLALRATSQKRRDILCPQNSSKKHIIRRIQGLYFCFVWQFCLLAFECVMPEINQIFRIARASYASTMLPPDLGDQKKVPNINVIYAVPNNSTSNLSRLEKLELFGPFQKLFSNEIITVPIEPVWVQMRE